MGLSEEDKKKMPYFIDKEFLKATETPEFAEAQVAFESALFDFLYENIKANLVAHKDKPSVIRVVQGTTQLTDKLLKKVWNLQLPLLTAKMLERFDLVKKEKK